MNYLPPISFFRSIEAEIIDRIESAEISIFIVMAWFTSKPIKEALVDAKRNNPALEIGIVTDDNEINNNYFFNSRSEMESTGIKLPVKVDKRFLHRKFMVIDEQTTLIGSYNYTRKANFNAENLAAYHDKAFAQVHLRVFRHLTDADYIDENIQLLYQYPIFTQLLLSTYYPFNRKEYKKFASKIILGDCFTYNVGDYDEIRYEPGFIFNPKAKFDKKLTSEFGLPIHRDLIKNWTSGRNEQLIFSNYNSQSEDFDELDKELKDNRKYIQKSFKKMLNGTFSRKILEEKILSGVDIIKENTLWEHNFALFIAPTIVEELFNILPEVKRNYPDYGLNNNSNLWVIVD